ncbi:MAG TPA: acyltransferase, partial [Acidocella sp.]|nr:acyltransferase [Acidocella sp.]
MERLTRLDGLRGGLAVYVMLGHALPYVVLPPWVGVPFVHGEAAVDMFFALSGLVVVNSLARFEYHAGQFLAARARRLLPVYFAVLLFAVWLILVGSPVTQMPWIAPHSLPADFWALGVPAQFGAHLLAHIFLVQGLLPQGLLPWAFITLLGPAWSLSTEWQFYMVLAALGQRARHLVGLGMGLLGLGVLYRLVIGFLPDYWQFSRAFLPDASIFFALGVMSAFWMRRGDARPFWGAVLAVAVMGLVSGPPEKSLMPLAWAMVMYVQRFDFLPLLGWALDHQFAQFLGRISYPLYLLNAPVQRGCAMLVVPFVHGDARLFGLVWLPLAVMVPVLAAWLLHAAVERPFMRARVRRSPPA